MYFVKWPGDKLEATLRYLFVKERHIIYAQKLPMDGQLIKSVLHSLTVGYLAACQPHRIAYILQHVATLDLFSSVLHETRGDRLCGDLQTILFWC